MKRSFFKTILNTKEKKLVFNNFISLFSLRFFGYVFPLITLPYLTRVLGPEKFGAVSFAQAFCVYFILITDFGFNLSATREISIHRYDNDKVSLIFTTVMFIKLILLFISSLILIFTILIIERFNSDYMLYIYAFGTVIGQTLFPIWLFQGLEKMKFITIIQVISQVTFTFLVFIFIKDYNDYQLCALMTSFGSITGGVISIYFVFFKINVKLIFPSFYDIKYHLKQGGTLFLSNIAISIYTISNPFFLGLLSGDLSVGYYTIAQKLITSLKGLWSPVTQAMFPFFSKLSNVDEVKASKILVIMLKYSSIFSISITLISIIFASNIMALVGGDNYTSSILVFRILALTILPVTISGIVSVQGLIAFGLSKIYTKIVIIAACVHLFILPLFIHYFSYNGAALSMLLVESVKVIFEYYYYDKYIIKGTLKRAWNCNS